MEPETEGDDGVRVVSENGKLILAIENYRYQSVNSHDLFLKIAKRCSEHPRLAREEGRSGSGKTTVLKDFINLLQKKEGEDVLFLHLGEQIDSKILLGTYSSTMTPGDFVWLPGILTRAVKSGMWVVLENLDAAPMDVVSLLLPLIKNGELIVPGFIEPLRASSKFKMFCTLRDSADVGMTGNANLLKVFLAHCPIVQLKKSTGVELSKMLQDKYSNVSAISDQLVSVCVKYGAHVRHLWKLCQRISSQIYSGRITSVEDYMLEIIDCFCASLSCDGKLSMAQKLSYLCGGIPDEVIRKLCESHKPVLQVSATAITIGRAYVPRHTQVPPRMCFAYTQSSLCLLESVCRCVQMNEPTLLVGETGVGKTAVVNFLSQLTGNKLVVFNVCQQTDSSELLGGFRPIQTSKLVAPCREEFERLFHETFSIKENAQFLNSIQAAYTKQKWRKLFKLMVHSVQSALQKLSVDKDQKLYQEWKAVYTEIKKFQTSLRRNALSFSFSYFEGALVEAVRKGSWILLDEINLASPETLQCLSSLLEGPQGSFLLPERAELEAVKRHEGFRLFCCMNPATDIGKKSLPTSIRNRFTEFYVGEVQSSEDLRLLIQHYLDGFNVNVSVVNGIIRFYRAVSDLAQNKLEDGTGRRPHYSLRSLCRALQFARDHSCVDLLRSLYEGFCVSYLSELHTNYHPLMLSTIKKCLDIPDSVLSYCLPKPPNSNYIFVEGFWLKCGSEPVQDVGDYVLTNYVRKNLKNLARVVSAERYPVLLQGPTSAGKTSLIQYLAKKVGQKCVRINNHEHTDLQEYVGMYTADSNGQLVFQEGILVTAMRHGYWIILDELNLAPTDVLEALNRVLDDNRELFIPETQQLVKAHSQFLLFGTQNPPGSYGGRKVLSRAFRNRFVELHFEDIPSKEVEVILQQKCQLPPSYSKKMVAVMKELQERRSTSGIFSGKYGLITLRDLFRWANRYSKAEVYEKFYDWEQHLAEDGFMLLGGRLRDANERQVISEVINKHFKCSISDEQLFGFDGCSQGVTTKDILNILHSHTSSEYPHLVWTKELVQMAVLVYRAIMFNEPVLLVGNTGCGKTTVCQFLSSLMKKKLFPINCHMHTEAADFLGGLRPRRKQPEENSKSSALFEWRDGVVVQAMKEGGCLLIDEISLAEDAVLERLNSLLESGRTLVVAERSRSKEEVYQVVAAPGFTFMATMNPGGDYGKKELSPALRNRFVEIWCSTASSRDSCAKIITHNLDSSLTGLNSPWTEIILDFLQWICNYLHTPISIRDLLSWIRFINQTLSELGPESSFYHGACLVFLDSIGCGSVKAADVSFSDAEQTLNSLLSKHQMQLKASIVTKGNEFYGISPFFIEKGPEKSKDLMSYSLEAPGPHLNAFRLLRAMQLGRPLLLEGAPGVGKTSLVSALARASGHSLVRINLSEHTDISDLFGADLPVEGQQGICFAWKDGPFLSALKKGSWILLDEMNLASQSVLEGLNACLDHRGEIYVPELGKSFQVKPGTRVFACQNPLQQGGGRKGLPRSFVNRFTQVFIKILQPEDLLYITSSLYPNISVDTHQKMISFTTEVQKLVNVECGIGVWEYNLRDILRWCELCQDRGVADPGEFMEMIYCARLRDCTLRMKVFVTYSQIFNVGSNFCCPPHLGSYFSVSKHSVQVGRVILPKPDRYWYGEYLQSPLPLRCQLTTLEVLANCVKMNWMAIVVGESACGKSSVIRTLAQLTGHKLVEFPMNSDMDTTELVGGFQQVNMSRHCCNIAAMCDCVVVGLLDLLKRNTSGKLKEYESSLLKISLDISKKFSPAALLDGDDEEGLDTIIQQLSESIEKIKCIADACGVLPVDISETLSMLEAENLKLVCGASPGRFEWVDSVLVTALHHGHWLVISHANFCSPSVLDRLNCLLEPGGYLSIDERGVADDTVPIVHPHPEFRLFLTMDPVHGEISRAMRNRGIEVFMLPNEGAMANNDDLLSLVVSTTNLDIKVAQSVVHFSQVLPEMTASKVLTLTKCVACSPTESDLLKTAKILGLSNEVKAQVEVGDIEASGASDVSCLILPAIDHLLRPSQCMVQRDIVSLLRHFNELKEKGCFNERKCSLGVPELSAAFEVFVSSGTTEDRMFRQNFILQLLESLEAENCPCIEAVVYVHVMKEYQQWSCSPGVTSSKVNSLILGTNPLSCGSENGLVCLHSITILEVLRQLVKLGDRKLLLQLSKDVFEGQCPVECLEHSSLVYLYSYVRTALLAVLEVSTNTESLNASIQQEVVLGWLREFVYVCALPQLSLSTIACSWMYIKCDIFLSLSPLLKTTSQWQFLEGLAANLYPLEEMTRRSRVYETIRQTIGPGCSSRPTEMELQHKNQVVAMDSLLLESSRKLRPFLMLCEDDFKERKRLLAEWFDSKQHKIADGDHHMEGVSASFVSSPNPLISMSAIYPAVFSLKHLLSEVTSDICSEHVVVLNLLEYIRRLSYISVRAFEPLLMLSTDKGTVDSLFCSIINCINSGCGILIDMSLTEGAIKHSLSESVCSLFCFEYLAPQQCDSGSHMPMLGLLPECNLGSYSTKTEELQNVLQYLWINASSPVYNVQQNRQMDVKCLKGTLRRFVLAVHEVGLSKEESTSIGEITSQHIMAVCTAISSIMPIKDDPDFWKTVQNELLTSLMAIQQAERCLDQSDVLTYVDLALLETTAVAQIHLGLAMASVLCPPLVDPLTMSTTENQFLCGIVEHYSLLLEAWNEHYVNMTGKKLDELYNNSNTSPEFCQMPSCLALLLSVKNTFDEIYSSKEFVSVADTNDRKYSRFSSLCIDLMNTVCSRDKVHSMLSDFKSGANLDTLTKQLLAINKALSVFVQQIRSEFQEYVDIAEPFLSAVLQVFDGMSTLSTLKVHNWKELAELALNIGQYPVGNYSTCSIFEWVMYLFKSLQSGTVMSSELSHHRILHKRLLLICVETSLQMSRSVDLRPHQAIGFSNLLKYCWSMWRVKDNERRKEAAEEDSIYLFKSKTHQISNSDEAQEQEALNNMFPSYNVVGGEGDTEFSVDATGQLVDHESQTLTHFSEHFSPEELYKVCSLHLAIFGHESREKVSQGLHQPPLDTYHIASYLVNCLKNLPGLGADFLLSGAHIRMCHHHMKSLQSNFSILSRNFDIYKDPAPSEAITVVPVLTALAKRVEYLLKEWPDHPVLTQIFGAIEKVLSLNVSEPLMKVLSGVEYILRRAQDWEAYASSRVSMFQQLESLMQVVLKWREMELSCWRKLFSVCEHEMEVKSSNLWFYLYGLCHDENIDKETYLSNIYESILKFMETSSVGDFHLRLKMLKSFHVEMTVCERKQLSDLLGNLFYFYTQFASSVSKSNQESLNTLEKELKEFLEILRWNDGSYWAVKESSEKSHRKLLKFLNRYKAILEQPVKPVLSVSVTRDTAANLSTAVRILLHSLRGLKFVSDQTPPNSFIVSLRSDSASMELATEDLLHKMKKLVGAFVAQDSCLFLCDLVDSLSGHASQVMCEVQSEDFVKEVDEGKRKAAIKLSKLRKQNALGGLFKTLKKNGVSYRKATEFSMETILKLPVVQLPAKLDSLNQAQDIIDSCYYGCITGMSAMLQAFVQPSKELTVSQIIRCKGFACHLMSTICEQRSVLSEAMYLLSQLQNCVNTWRNLQSSAQQAVTRDRFDHWKSTLCSCVELCLESITSFSKLIQSMPAEFDHSFSPLPKEMLFPVVSSRTATVGETALKLLEDHCEQLQSLYIKLVHQEQCSVIPFYTMVDVRDLQKGFELVKSFKESASESLELMLGCHSSGLFLFLIKLCSQLDKDYEQFHCWLNVIQQCERDTVDLEAYRKEQMSPLVNHILVSVQRVIHRHNGINTATETTALDFECCKDLHRLSMININDMQIDETLKLVQHVLEMSADCTKDSLPLLRAVYPLLEQYYLLSKKVSVDLIQAHIRLCQLFLVLSEFFTTLAIKGFCTPCEEDMEESGGTEFIDMEAGGFDDGQGNQNVSSQAETDNLDVGREGSENKADKSQDQDESDIDVEEDFEGNMEDINEEAQQGRNSDDDEDEEENSEDVQMGEVGSEQPNQIDRNMWAGEDQDNKENNINQEDEAGGGTAVDEESRIVAKDDEAGEQPSDDQQSKKFAEPSLDEQQPSDQFDVNDMEPPATDEEDYKSVSDFGDLSLDEGMEEQISGDAESDDGGEVEGDVKEAVPEQDMEQISEESQQTSDPTESPWTADQVGHDGFEPNSTYSVGDKSLNNTSGKDSQKTPEAQASGDCTATNGHTGDVLANLHENAPQKSGIRRNYPQHDNPSALDDDGCEAKRQRLMDANETMSEKPIQKDSSVYQHVYDETTEDYDVAWDAAKHEQSGGSLPPPPPQEDLFTDTDAAMETHSEIESVKEASEHKSETGEALQTANNEMDVNTKVDKDVVCTLTPKTLETFFSSGDSRYPNTVKSDDDQLRDSLMTAVNHLQEKQTTEKENQEAVVLWMKYEALVFSLSQALYDELRLILLPTKAAQLKGDYRNGKRLNMRRIIPYIASNFQNDRIWLRRTKPSQREYQVLVAVDDSSSMHENQCKEMAYESLALISTALSRLDCGQLGVCRFGESVEVLHSLEKPFSAHSGGFILQHLMFNQTRTNFVELLQVAYSMFNNSLHRKSGSQLEISQLLVILSDGRGVFADGVQTMETNIRRLSDIRVFTVFVILDSLSKDSVVDIKVPLFTPGKPPVISSYLELFPFSYYIVLRDVKKMPVVLGQALRQWFEVIVSRTET